MVQPCGLPAAVRRYGRRAAGWRGGCCGAARLQMVTRPSCKRGGAGAKKAKTLHKKQVKMPNNPQLAWVFSDSVWVNCFVSVNNLSTRAIENEKIAVPSPKKGAGNAPGPRGRPPGAQKVGDVKVVSVWRALKPGEKRLVLDGWRCVVGAVFSCFP